MAGPDAGVEQVGLQEDLPVGDRDDVRRDVGGDVVGLGLDDRQPGHRAAAQLVGQLGAALEQPGVQVEDVARVGLAARRAAQQQRDRRGTPRPAWTGRRRRSGRACPGTSSAGRWPSRCRARCTCSPAGSEAGAATIVVYSIAPASSSDCSHLRRWSSPSGRSRRRCSAPGLAGSPESQLAFWLMIVSIAIAVLPVCRSPMISCRWPRPIAVIASMALMPVCIGSFTGCRCTTVGAWISSGAQLGVLDRAEAVERLAERARPCGRGTRRRPGPRAPRRSA